MRKQNVARLLAGALSVFLFECLLSAAPPLFDPIGEERSLNSEVYVTEGDLVEFFVTASDPDGDPLTFTARDVPPWADFDPATGKFSGIAPLWASDYAIRKDQPGIFDVTFTVSDGTFSVDKIVTINVLDSSWTLKTMAGLVADRPISAGGAIGTPVDITVVEDKTIRSQFGGGKYLRKVVFAFTSQVPGVSGWEDDWKTSQNEAYLPLSTPSATNAGALVEGCYAGEWGRGEFGERACAELDIPVLVIDRDWDFGHPGDLMEKYDTEAVETRDPEYLFYVFSTAHYLRSVDALITVIDTMTSWPVSYEDFKAVVTGHSKLGRTCQTAAAADPGRVAGFMASGASGVDTSASRLLGKLQGAHSTKPEDFPNYRGTMMKTFTGCLSLQEEMNPYVRTLFVQGTNDGKGTTEGYTAKYLMGVSLDQLAVPHRIGCVPNLHHTTKSSYHSTAWRMLLAHTFLNRPLSKVEDVTLRQEGGGIAVEALLSGAATVEEVRVWATNQSDRDTSDWDGFAAFPMALENGLYAGTIPADSTACYVEVVDEAQGVRGITSSAPVPVDRDYPLLRLPPGDVTRFRAFLDIPDAHLRWTNPRDADFAGVIITCSNTHFPATPLDGVQVYDGGGHFCSHPLGMQKSWYYSAFTYDALGDYSGGAFAKGTGRPVVVF